MVHDYILRPSSFRCVLACVCSDIPQFANASVHKQFSVQRYFVSVRRLHVGWRTQLRFSSLHKHKHSHLPPNCKPSRFVNSGTTVLPRASLPKDRARVCPQPPLSYCGAFHTYSLMSLELRKVNPRPEGDKKASCLFENYYILSTHSNIKNFVIYPIFFSCLNLNLKYY